MKNFKLLTFRVLLAAALTSAVLFTACDHFSVSRGSGALIKSGYGRISLSLAGGEIAPQEAAQARTVIPSVAFDKYEYVFTKAGETNGTEVNPDNDGSFIVEVGSYTVEVKAYIGSDTLAASGVSEEFTVSNGSNATVTVPLSGVDTGQGTFSYTITYPAGASVEITLQKWPGLNNITLNPATNGNEITQTLALGAGSYLLTVLIDKVGLYAGINEAVHIYPTQTTVCEKEFNDGDLLDDPVTPGLEYELINGGTAYSVKAENTSLSGVVVIPATYNGLPVTEIGNIAFYECTSLTSVTFAAGSAIPEANFADDIFNAGCNLKTAYETGGAGTYTRTAGGDIWTKQ